MEAVFQHGQASTLKMGYVHIFLLCIFNFSFFPFHPVAGCSVFEKQYGNVSEDQAIEIGSPFRFWCALFHDTLEEYGVSSKDIILKLGSKVLPQARIVDNYTVEYKVEQAKESDSGYYKCSVPIPEYESPQLVCMSSVDVGTKPGKVSNFSCMSLEYRNLTCSWTPPPNRVRTNYELQDYLFDNPSLTRVCPLPVPRRSSCMFSLDTKPPYRQNTPILNFILKGTNSLGNITEYFSINHYEIVKPGIPSKVSFRDVSKTSMVLEILSPRGLENGEFFNGLVYEVRYYSISTKLDIIKVETVKNKTNANIEIRNLVPHTQYKFEIRCRLNITGDHYYWSDVVNVTEITQADVPYLAPIIDSSSFEMKVIDNNASITLYWKAVPSEFENGAGFHYVVKYHEHYVPTRFARHAEGISGPLILLENSTTHTFKGMDKDTAYIFTIVAANDVGKSSNETAVIVVDKAKKLLPGPKDITAISHGQGHYEVSYHSPDPKITTFTLFICETLEPRPATCEGPMYWIGNTNNTHHKLHLPNSRTNYQFAVSSVSNGMTSGLHWAPCIVTYGVQYEVKNVQAIPKNATSLKVMWSYTCPAISKVIRDAEVSLCPFEGSCTVQNFEHCSLNDMGIKSLPSYRVTDPSKTELIIGALHPYTKYFIVMRVQTAAGWGRYSDFSCESTMSSAPSDPPSDVHAQIRPVQDSQVVSLQVFFEPPHTPNGVITRYIVYYNKTSPIAIAYHKEVRVQENKRIFTMLDNIFYHTNYSIEVSACVRQACSPRSDPVYLYTGIMNPGTVSLPRVELRETFVNISWDPPLLPNGPLDLYQIRVESNDSKLDLTYNVTDQSYLIMERECDGDKKDESIYAFQVRAVNMKDDMPLYGDYSNTAKTILCPSGLLTRFEIGLIVGGTFAILILGFASYNCFKWINRNVLEAKRTEVKLPKGLESSLDNPLSSYDKFKSGLQNNHDAGIPYDRAYERFFSTTSEGDVKNTEEHSKRGTSDRNLSGESNFSGKCHDSISSANTTKTHNSIDSGAEIESPPSPDSFCSDSCSANTTPRAFKPGLDIVNEINQLTSKDSGLERDGVSQAAQSANLGAKGMWYVKRPNDAHLNAYSRFAVRGASSTPPYVPHGEQNLVESLSLSNSEPSVADFDVGDGTEPLVNPVMQPYSKFGLARSASNGINISSQKPGYSKFGIVYRPLKSSQKFGLCDQQVFPAATAHCIPAGLPARCGSLFKKKEDVARTPMVVDVASGAYSKFGVVEPDSSNSSCNSSPDMVHNPAGNPGRNSYISLPPVANKWIAADHHTTEECGSCSNYSGSLPSESSAGLELHPDYTNGSGLNAMHSPMNGASPSHRTNASCQDPNDNVPDFLGPDFKNGFVSMNMLGGCGYKIGEVENDPSSSKNNKLKPLIQICLDADELIRCIDNGCLPMPELVFHTPKLEGEGGAVDSTLVMGGNVSGATQSETPNCIDGANGGQTEEIGGGVFGELTEQFEFNGMTDSSDTSEADKILSSPSPNGYVPAPPVIRNPNAVAQIIPQSNSSVEFV